MKIFIFFPPQNSAFFSNRRFSDELVCFAPVQLHSRLHNSAQKSFHRKVFTEKHSLLYFLSVPGLSFYFDLESINTGHHMMNSHVRAGTGKVSVEDGEDVGARLVHVEQLLLLLLLLAPLVTAHITVMHYSLQWDALKVFGG